MLILLGLINIMKISGLLFIMFYFMVSFIIIIISDLFKILIIFFINLKGFIDVFFFKKKKLEIRIECFIWFYFLILIFK